MFDPQNLQAVATLTDADLAALPPVEDETFEHKGSATGEAQLATKIQKATSGQVPLASRSSRPPYTILPQCVVGA